MEKRIVARWESRGRAHWVELYHGEFGYSYRRDGAGGSFSADNDDEAIHHIEMTRHLIMANDAAKNRMKRVQA